MEEATLNDLYQELWFRLRNEGKIVWTTKDKRVIPIKDMTLEHIVNTIKMLEDREEIEEHIGDMDPMDYYD